MKITAKEINCSRELERSKCGSKNWVKYSYCLTATNKAASSPSIVLVWSINPLLKPL
jgi:hypothetical protein